jgi:hypothetical protein
MNDLKMRGVLFFSSEEPHVAGYFVINGTHFEIAGWQSPPVQPKDISDASGSGQGARECDPA